jgi:hypothetical protein
VPKIDSNAEPMSSNAEFFDDPVTPVKLNKECTFWIFPNCAQYTSTMADDPRILEIAILDELPGDLVDKAVTFFRENYPSDSKKQMDPNFFIAKVANSNPNGQGYFTVALYDGEVVGTCTAVRKTLIHKNQVVHAVEIGDTFTSKNFRKSCRFLNLYPGTTSFDEYLNKSIFGRLATETLDRARADGVTYVYGTPNFQAKLSWLGRMNFALVDGSFTYRINAASIRHEFYKRSKLVRILGRIYNNISHLLSRLVTREYSMKLISEGDFNFAIDAPDFTKNEDSIQLVNSESWIKARFINNIDKNYKIIKIESRKDSGLCGYLFFLEHEREDNFKLLILSKDIFYDKTLHRLKIPLARIAADRFFEYENLSIWIDIRRVSLKYRTFFGFISKPFKVDIVGKSLTENSIELQLKNFYDFQYGDSDLA